MALIARVEYEIECIIGMSEQETIEYYKQNSFAFHLIQYWKNQKHFINDTEIEGE